MRLMNHFLLVIVTLTSVQLNNQSDFFHVDNDCYLYPMNPKFQSLQVELALLESSMIEACSAQKAMISTIHPDNILSAKNLLHYLAFRSQDRTSLQLALHEIGLSALSNSESHILSQVQAVRRLLGGEYKEGTNCQFTYPVAKEKLTNKTDMLFGQKSSEIQANIMVTLDPSTTKNHAKLVEMLQNGMNIARINCAHGDKYEWIEMVEAVRAANREAGTNCRIYMDLAGPKIRTAFLGKHKTKKYMAIKEDGIFYLSASRKGFLDKDIVISPSVPEVLPYLKPDQQVYFDDGKVLGIIETCDSRGVQVRVKKYFSKKHRIKADKGINFPDSKIKIPALTTQDREALPVMVEHADMIGYSFVNTAEDIRTLRTELAQYTDQPPPIILKIETALSVKNLPDLLLESLKDRLSGVMIARGDLAVEAGFKKLAEIQDDIMSVCEAAHVPVIWATQVLENLHKNGIATRSEITDAAHADLAECIMINKGPHTLTVIQYLKEIIKRSKAQRYKKRFLIGKLKLGKS